MRNVGRYFECKNLTVFQLHLWCKPSGTVRGNAAQLTIGAAAIAGVY
jgi:hypothetical protein